MPTDCMHCPNCVTLWVTPGDGMKYRGHRLYRAARLCLRNGYVAVGLFSMGALGLCQN